MHEVGIMESALESVEEQARLHGAHHVHRIVLRVGTLSGVDIEALRFAFDVVAAATVAAGAELTIETVSAQAYCQACNADFSASSGYIFSCPVCHGLSGQIRQGHELEIARLEMS